MILKTSGFKSWKKTAAFIVISIAMVLLTASAGAYFYLQSNHFREILNKSLVELSGDRIDLTDQIKIESLYPKIQVSFPNARARLKNFYFGYDRIRVRGLKLTLSPSVLFSHAKSGQTKISIDSLAAIASSKPGNQTTSGTELTIAEKLKEFLDRLSQMRVMLEIHELDYIQRSEFRQHPPQGT